MANEKYPFIKVLRSFVKFVGTFSETTTRVTAKPKTASLKASTRETSAPRKRKFLSRPTFFAINFSRIISLSFRIVYYSMSNHSRILHSAMNHAYLRENHESGRPSLSRNEGLLKKVHYSILTHKRVTQKLRGELTSKGRNNLYVDRSTPTSKYLCQ